VAGFLEAHNAWEREQAEQPTDENPAELPSDNPPADEQPVEAPSTDDQPADDQPADETQTQAQPEAKELTPESLSKLINETPGFKEFLDSAPPAVKGQLYQMARTNARAAGVLEHIPNAEAAKFAAETSNRFVTHRANFLSALEDPASIEQAYSQFAEEFAERDDKGEIIMQDGQPVYGEDFHALNNYIVGTEADIEIEDLEARIADQSLSEDDREAAEMTLMAYRHIKEYRASKNAGPKKPNLDGLTPEARRYLEQQQAELDAEREKLGIQKKEQTSEARAKERATYETTVSRRIGGSVGKRLQNMIAEDEKAGVFIPSIVTETRDPETGVSVFAQSLLEKFQEATYGRLDRKTGRVIGGVASIRDKMMRLVNRPPSKEAEEARVKYALELIDEHLPAIYEKEKRTVQQREIADRARRKANVDARQQLTTPEPRGGTAVQPKSMDPQSAYAEAKKQIQQQYPDLSDWEVQAKALVLKDQLLAGQGRR
jgi:hypothetical protein